MNDLDQKLRDYYADQRLSPAKLDHLLELDSLMHRPARRMPTWQVCAAALALALGPGLWAGRVILDLPSRAVTAEVVKNHRKSLEPEILSGDFTVIQAGLSRIDFALSPTQPELLVGYKVRGGRYCSLQGELAAQINLIAPDGTPCTLYVAPLRSEVRPPRQGVRQHEGSTVQIWHDAHRLFVLAR